VSAAERTRQQVAWARRLVDELTRWLPPGAGAELDRLRAEVHQVLRRLLQDPDGVARMVAMLLAMTEEVLVREGLADQGTDRQLGLILAVFLGPTVPEEG
jgi:hypothetical protein